MKLLKKGKQYMRGLIISMWVIGVAFVISWVMFIYFLNEGIKEYESNIGNELILDGDTLTIVDYSILNETYTLSDGREVSYKLIIK